MHFRECISVPETHGCSATAKRSGKSTAWRMPMRARYQHPPYAKPVVAHLERRPGSSKSRPLWAGRLNPMPGKAGWGHWSVRAPARLDRGRDCGPSAPAGHGFQGTQQNASGPALLLAGDIHAEIPAID